MSNHELEQAYQAKEKARAITSMRDMLTAAMVALNAFEATGNPELAEISLDRLHRCLKHANKRYPELVDVLESMER